MMLRLTLLESMAQAIGRLANLAPETDPLPLALQCNHTVNDTDVVANCIPSLRLLAGEDWLIFFERISQVEQSLRQDPAGVYAQMDFETRDRYRKVVERVARATNQAEIVVAQTAVSLAHRTQNNHENADSPTGHVGYYLLADGLSQLEHETGYQPQGLIRWRRALAPYTTPLYLGSVSLLTLIVALPFVAYAFRNGTGWLVAAAVFSRSSRPSPPPSPWSTGSSPTSSPPAFCPNWIFWKMVYRPNTVRWWSSPRCSPTPPKWTLCSNSWRCTTCATLTLIFPLPC